ncbi:hypothetical protein COOONC_20964 [Cooperia oncophora]
MCYDSDIADTEKKSAYRSGFTTLMVLGLTALVLTSPPMVTDHFARVLSTILAAIIIFLDTDAFCITNRLIVYCGDISYILYLVHWPVIVATRYFCDTQHLSGTAAVFAVVLSLLISIAAHHSVEVDYSMMIMHMCCVYRNHRVSLLLHETARPCSLDIKKATMSSLYSGLVAAPTRQQLNGFVQLSCPAEEIELLFRHWESIWFSGLNYLKETSD